METVTMKAPQGGGNLSFEGRQYPVNAQGMIEVPKAAVAYLAQYGYTLPPQTTQAREHKPVAKGDKQAAAKA